MTVIRGATTILQDSKAEISASVKELLDEVFAVNALQKEEVKAFIFSLTSESAKPIFSSLSEYARAVSK